MHDWRQSVKRMRAGFTMAEVLFAVALLGVMAAVAVPNVAAVQQNLRMMQLDATAQEIYNAAQYRLTALESQGKNFALQDELAADAGTYRVASMPADYAAAGGADWGSVALYHVASGTAPATTYLVTSDGNALTGTLAGGDYIIELSPSTGEVYSVFYWESDAGSLGYDDVKDARSAAVRAPMHLGYYGGQAVGALVVPTPYVPPTNPDDPDDPDEPLGPFDPANMDVQVVNEEELYIRLGNNFGDEAFDAHKLKVVVTLECAEIYDAKMQGTFTSSDFVARSGATGEIDLILDSPFKDSEGNSMHLKDLMASGKIDVIRGPWSETKKIPVGSNVKMTIEIYYDESLVKTIVIDKINTAFADYDRENSIVTVSSVRHLENLGSSMSDFDWNSSSYMKVLIGGDIDFDGTHWPDENVAASHRDAENKNPVAYLEPIVLHDSFNNSGTNVVDGQGHVLSNFVIGSESTAHNDTGLFSVASVGLKNIIMDNATVRGSDNTGALCGRMTNTGEPVENCQVLNSSIRGNTNVGALFGNTSTIVIKNCTAESDVSGFTSLGGLIGTINGSEVSGCAVVPAADGSYFGKRHSVSGTSYVGGFVGTMNSGSVSNSAANIDVSGTGGNIGGFVGQAQGSAAVYNSVYQGGFDAASNTPSFPTVSGGNSIGGFVGLKGSSSPFENCLAVANVTSAGGDQVGGFCGVLSNGAAGFKNCGVRGYTELSGTVGRVSVKGANAYIGGFVGWAKGGTCESCFASIDVGQSSAGPISTRHVGGFAGATTGGAGITLSYASGDVEGSQNVGGFVGVAQTGTNVISGCYTTSDVRAWGNAAGFVGRVETDAWIWNEDYAFGRVYGLGGISNTFGGFVGTAADGLNLADHFNAGNTRCDYLKAQGYNDSFSNNVTNMPTGASYAQLAVSGNDPAAAFPYAASLKGKAFPFGMVRPEHYGDWAAM